MKTLLFFITLIISSFAFAGPEDHMYETCYKSSVAASYGAPTELCFDSLFLSENKDLLITSGTFNNLPEQLEITQLKKLANDSFDFRAEKTLVNVWNSGCGDGLNVKLVVLGNSSLHRSEQIESKNVTITLEVVQTNDTCHSRPQVTKIDYLLK